MWFYEITVNSLDVILSFDGIESVHAVPTLPEIRTGREHFSDILDGVRSLLHKIIQKFIC